MRCKMANWMIEVLSAYNLKDSTFFLSMLLMDSYYKNENIKKQDSDLYLTGVTCMFIASKFEDIMPLSMNIVVSNVAHDELQQSDIKDKEMQIMRVLQFEMPIVA